MNNVNGLTQLHNTVILHSILGSYMYVHSLGMFVYAITYLLLYICGFLYNM